MSTTLETNVSGRPTMFIVEVLYNFFPSDKQHLTLSQYEKIKVVETHKSDWWIGEKSNGEVGLFPANYVRRVQDVVEESPRRREKTFNKPVTFDPKKTTKTVDPQLQKRKEIASQLGLGTVDWDEFLSDDDEDEDEALSDDDAIVADKKPSPVSGSKTQQPNTTSTTAATTTNQTMTTNATPPGKFVTEEAYEKKKKDLQEALQKQMEDQMIKQKQMDEIKKLKEELLKAKTEASSTPRGEEKSTTPRTTPRGTPGLSNQEVQQLMQKQQADFEKKQKEMEKDYESKLKQANEKTSSSSAAAASTEMQKTVEKLKQKNTQLEGQVVTLDKSLTDIKQKYNTDVKDLSQRLKEQKDGNLKHVSTKVIRMKKQVQAIKFENGYLKKEAMDMQKDFLSAIQQISTKGMKKLVDSFKDLEDQYKKEVKERRMLYNQLQDLKGNIRVNLRVRPLLPMDGQSEICIDTVDEREIKVSDRDSKKIHKFEFDNVFGINSSQEQVFEDVKPLATSILDGYNVCIFAYGQTGSGKTFTMEGTPSNRGVNYRTLDELFSMVAERKGEYTYEVEVAVMEIYNETLYDLLVKDKSKLDIMLSSKVSIPGLTKHKVSSSEDVRKVLAQGYDNRAVGSNNINAHSSRSHCIVSVFVEGINSYTNQKVSGKLHLIDLAGSERLKRTDVKGDRLKEAQSINLSLSALGDVISSLATKKGHIPYRNSKLTSLLQDSLGGNSKILMFVNVSPTAESCPETICSLGFAQRARKVELGKAEKNITATSK